jgi:hypothetical protein
VDEIEQKSALKSLFSTLVRSEPDVVSVKVSAVISRLSHISHAKGSNEELFIRLDSQFSGGDIGTRLFFNPKEHSAVCCSTTCP